MNRKGIILAGGSGSRLFPITQYLSKQLLPIYDKPMIYYPLSTLMLTGVREIMIISTPDDLPKFQQVLGNGKHLGLKLSYEAQLKPEGIAQAFIIAENFIGRSHSALILGDNIFYGHDLESRLQKASENNNGATIFAYHVKDPHRYGVVEFNSSNLALSLEEKPKKPKSSYAITGLYFYDNSVIEIAKKLKPSKRGELEITDLNNEYLSKKKLTVQLMDRGYAWLDTGTHDSLLEAGQFISTIEKRQGLKVCCPEEIAYQKGWISKEEIIKISNKLKNNDYGIYLKNLTIN